jgi:hypothetical protein
MTIMIRSKVLSDSAWKEVLAKNKAVKDNGMLKALADIKKLGDDDHDNAQKILDDVVKLTAQLKKSKDTAASPAVTKFLAELSSAADVAMRDIAKAKVEAEKKARAEAEAKKQAEKKPSRDAEDDDEEEESPALLTTKLIPLLRQINKGEMMHVLVARLGKQVAVMMSRKPIAPVRRKLLAEQLGASGGVKYFSGHCLKEEGATTFVMKSEVAGLAKQLKLALLNQTGMRVKRLSCRGEDGETDDDLEDDDDIAVADSGADEDAVPRFVPGVDVKERESGDGEDGVPKFVPGVDIESRPSPALASAPQEWDGARETLQRNINSLKRAVQSQVADEGDELVAEINDHLEKLDRIFGKLDRRLADSLASAGAAREAASRREALRESRSILAEYIRYVSSEPLIDHLDNNPFGVKTELKSTLSASLTKLARAIG